MGPGGSGCLDKARLRKIARMNVRYVAAAADTSGSIPSFAIFGKTNDGEDDIGVAADTSGVVSTSINHGPEDAPLPVGTEERLRRLVLLRNCALLECVLDSLAILPASMREVSRDAKRKQAGALFHCVSMDTLRASEPDE